MSASEQEPVNCRRDVNSDNPARVNRLSEYQVRILRWLLRRYDEYEQRAREHPGTVNSSHLAQVNRWGIPWPRHAPGTSRSASASMSRALKRLEEHGLVLRCNFISGDRHHAGGSIFGTQTRTISVALTDEGRKLAEVLERDGAP